MNNILKKSVLNVAVATVLTVGFASSALAAGTIGPINSMTQAPVSLATVVAGTAGSNETVVQGTISNNADSGWNIAVASLNNGSLLRAGTLGGAGSEISYTKYHLNSTAGAGSMGSVATTPYTDNVPTAAGTTNFNTGVATTATVAKNYELGVSWNADTALLAGVYSDTITLTITTNPS